MRTTAIIALFILLFLIAQFGFATITFGSLKTSQYPSDQPFGAVGGAIGSGIICAAAIIGSVILITSSRKNNES